jgi:excisionase family DNA binding protein
LPDAVYSALLRVVEIMAAGDAVTIVPLHRQLTTNEAANLLHVSRPFLIKLLESGAIPYSKTGSHRRVRLADVLAYRERRDAECIAHLDAILAEGQSTGTYN